MARKKAQSILEYVIVLAAIIVAVIAATAGKDSVVQKAVGRMFDDSSGVITSKTGDFLDRAAGGSTDASRDGGE